MLPADRCSRRRVYFDRSATGSVSEVERFAEPILHVDMDAFFVEVERLRDRSLRGVPVVVGGLGRRGVVASASYEARLDGVHSAMPMVEARRRCPDARFVAPDHGEYGEASRRVFAVLESFAPSVEPLSVDEAFMDIAGLRRLHPSPEAVAIAIRTEMRRTLELPASVGIAPNKFLAKLASEEAKPDGWFKVHAGEELTFLHPLSVRRLWGVGEATHASLEGLGVATIGDIAELPTGVLERRLGVAVGAQLTALAHGVDSRSVSVDRATKSISVEETFERDVNAEGALTDELMALCDRLASRLRRSGYAGRTVTLKVRLADFTTVTRSSTAAAPLRSTPDLWAAATKLWRRVPRGGQAVRLLGIGVSGLVTETGGVGQLVLEPDRRRAAAKVMDEVRDRFGDSSVMPARLAPQPPNDAPSAD